MTEFSESVYICSSERADGAQWLRDNELAGYVLEPRGEWVQVFPDWKHISDDDTRDLLANSSDLLIHYYFAEEQFWAFSVYRDGNLAFRYESIWLVDEYVAEGKGVDKVADILDVSAGELDNVIRSGSESPSWEELAQDAAQLADLLRLPNYAWASFDNADEMGLDDALVGPKVGYDISGDDAGAGDEPKSVEDFDIPDEIDVPEAPPSVQAGSDAPWQEVYELASYFLKHLHDEQLIELTLDNRLARDRLIERLTKTVIENPVRGDSQLLGYWFDELMTCPEIVDVFATDDMLEEVYQQAKQDVEADRSPVDNMGH